MLDFTAKAHGRINLMGEHTDYNNGWVLFAPTPQMMKVFVTVRSDREVQLSTSALHLPGSSTLKYQLGQEGLKSNWIDYIQGCTKYLLELGHTLSGFDLRIESQIQTGFGLASGTALIVCTLKALNKTFNLKMSDIELAQLGLKIEKDFLCSPVTFTDFLACSLIETNSALYLDSQKMTGEQVPLLLDKMDLVVVYSGIAPEKNGGEAFQRPFECEEACNLLGISSLRDLSFRELFRLDSLPMSLRKRARHVVTENERVQKSVAALKAGNPRKLGELFYESHRSMKEDFLISLPEIDLLVELFKAEFGTYGARMTSAGFGGSVVAVTEKGLGRKITDAVIAAYQVKTPHQAVVLL